MNGWLIYRVKDAEKNRAFIDWMQAEAALLGITLQLVIYHELTYGIKDGRLFINWKGREKPDFVIMRAIDPLLSAQFEWLGIRVFNNSRVASIANDKANTHQLFATHGIPMVDTQFLNREELKEGTFRFPVVLKAVNGRSGSEVYLLNSLDDLPPLTSERFIVQSLATPGRDLRVFVMGKKVIGSVLRESNIDFRANYTLGGNASLYQLSSAECELVDKIITILPVDFAGIDFVFDDHNRLLLNEIEDIVGSRTITSLTDINIARLYLQHIMKGVQ
ncbi:ATP-grasp domain-containing protein [Gracilibacillus sp. HCP3S3_G5_1]|uniref:ATP-grasp domain-containing protein n=1 Tax=unclassified Gracilibacillus TaxID=2625209 RepID=UPI003F8A3F21